MNKRQRKKHGVKRAHWRGSVYAPGHKLYFIKQDSLGVYLGPEVNALDMFTMGILHLEDDKKTPPA